MTPAEFQALEKIQIGDIKSAMDQIKFLITKNNETQVNLNKIFTALNEKVNLKSEYLSEVDPAIVIGSGTISTLDIDVTGIGTLFTKEIIAGNEIKVGTEFKIVDTVNSDTSLTLLDPFTVDSTNQVYGIRKLISRETLTGNFNFGVTNGDIFNGVINQGSILQHYGRMTNDYDVINVQYAKRLSNPAMIRAANSILRTGDTIGDSTTHYIYSFTNLTWTFEATTQGYYFGAIDLANNAQGRASFVNRGYVDDIKEEIQKPMYANWNAVDSENSNYQVYNVNGFNICSSFGPSYHAANQLNLSEYFEYTANGLKCIKAGLFIVTVGGSDLYNKGADQYSVESRIYLNTILKSQDLSQFDGPSGFSARPGSSSTAFLAMQINDLLVAGLVQNNNFGNGTAIRHYCHIAKIGTL